MGRWHHSAGQEPLWAWYEVPPEARELVEALYDEGWVEDCDWMAYYPMVERYQMDERLINRALWATVRHLITAHLRANRFVEGHLGAVLESGHLLRLIRRGIELLRKRAAAGMDGPAPTALPDPDPTCSPGVGLADS